MRKEIRGNLKRILKREEYIRSLRINYGIIVEEFRLKDGQKCGYFHITCPIFKKNQKPGDVPVGFEPPITEYTEMVMKSVVNRFLKDEWYRTMCEEWANKNLMAGEYKWED